MSENTQKLRSLTRRAVVHAVDDSGAEQMVTVEAHAGYPRSKVPVHQQFGFASHVPLDGAVTHVVALGGDEADLTALPPSNPSLAHMGDLGEGESIHYDAVGQAVYLQDGRIVRVIAHSEMTVEIGGQTVLDLTPELATLNVPLKVNGTITATEDVTGNGVSLHDHVHTEVKYGSDTSGPPKS
ncbi:phage baseplate assembly protein [Acetobacter persici]|uniref:phage baseplate assembly protein V n=1 Tax=Acetobacter persici TaxID=1076596 RepID=UPI0020CC3F51|nr:phage baseplate assembly protein V [Acetobacter persici]MCP9320099.1 phage baseplate assembly protein [Acetobacter persici]